MKYVELPIYKSALDFAVYMETIVKSFDKYEKYTIGEDLRNYSKELLFCVHRANIADKKLHKLRELRDKCEEIKMLLQLCKELKAFKSFKQFEHSSKLIISVCKQAQAWYNHFARVT
jgi:hypothetical protein